MPGVDWRFPAYLVGAMALGLVLTYIQMRAYNAEVNRALRVARGDHLMLVSGRGRSFRGGAIVIAIVDILTREIIWARSMVGATVFARFRNAPELVGPMAGAVDRVQGKQYKAAVEMALAQVRPAPIDPEFEDGTEFEHQTEPTAGTPGPAAPPAPDAPRVQPDAPRVRPPARDAAPRLVRKRVPPTE